MEAKTVFVADPISPEALEILRREPSIQIDFRPGLPIPEKNRFPYDTRNPGGKLPAMVELS